MFELPPWWIMSYLVAVLRGCAHSIPGSGRSRLCQGLGAPVLECPHLVPTLHRDSFTLHRAMLAMDELSALYSWAALQLGASAAICTRLSVWEHAVPNLGQGSRGGETRLVLHFWRAS